MIGRALHMSAAALFCASPLLSATWPHWAYLLLFIAVGAIAEILNALIMFALGID